MEEDIEKVKKINETQKIEIGTTFKKNYSCFNCFEQITKKEYTSKNSHLPRIVLNNINTKLNKEYLVQVVLFNSTAENIFYSKGNILVRRIRTNETRKMDINIKYIFAFNTEKDDSGNYKHTFMGLYKLVHKDRFWSWERQNQNETIVSIDEESIINAIKI